MRSIRLYWHGGRKGHFNFGDALAPLVVEMVGGRPVRYAHPKECELVAIGSILNKVILGRWRRLLRGRLDPIRVWGTGSIVADGLGPAKHLLVHALRGHATRNGLGLSPRTPLGDPGLLVGRLIDGRKIRKEFRWGVIPHIADRCDPIICQLVNDNPGAVLIDLGDPDPVAVIRQIAKCSFVISTSLHGLVAADALGVPNVRLQVGQRVIGGDWKFFDYATAVGRNDLAAVSPAEARNLAHLETGATGADAATVADLCDRLERAFDSAGVQAPVSVPRPVAGPAYSPVADRPILSANSSLRLAPMAAVCETSPSPIRRPRDEF